MKALVTGANGFIGSHLCEALVNEGHEVRGLVRRTSDLVWIKDLGLGLAYGDLRDAESLRQAAVGMDWVFHLGATVRAKDAADFEHVNCEGTKLVAGACIDAGVSRLVFFSSVAAGGPTETPDRPRHEGDEPAPVSLYGKGKLGAEKALQELQGRLHSVILRFPAVHGPRDRDAVMMLRWVKRGLMPVFGGTFSTVFVKDAVQAAVLAAERPVVSGSVYFISDGHSYSYADLAMIAGKLLGRRPMRIRIPRWLLHTAGWFGESLTRGGSILNRDKAKELSQECWVCSTDKARAELGYAPEYTLETGMAETIRWYQEMRWL